jgi:hypothetical protein
VGRFFNVGAASITPPPPRLVTQFKISLLGHYQCHQPIRLKKPEMRTDLQSDRLTTKPSHTT